MAGVPGRHGAEWRRARAMVLQGATHCMMPNCKFPGVPLDFFAPKLSALYPTVDHLIMVKDTVGWSEQERRAVLNDPHYLRPAHAACNASRNQNPQRRARPPARPTRDWGI